MGGGLAVGCRLGPEVEGSSGGDVGAVGEPTPTSGGERVGAEGEPTCHGGVGRGGEHVGAEGEPTCHGGGGRGGDVGAGGKPTSIKNYLVHI